MAQYNYKAMDKNGKAKKGSIEAINLDKAKEKLKLLTKRNRGRNIRRVMQEVKVSIRGWIGYFRVAYEADADVLG